MKVLVRCIKHIFRCIQYRIVQSEIAKLSFLSMFKNNKLLLILRCAWPQATFYICDLQPATRNLQNSTSQDWGGGPS